MFNSFSVSVLRFLNYCILEITDTKVRKFGIVLFLLEIMLFQMLVMLKLRSDALWNISLFAFSLCLIPAPVEKAASGEKASSGTTADAHEEFVDDFRVGERVWVNGNKPGFIQFLGETQFAPGQWAGIVLDEPIGKNDGSVAGVRYFQCEPLRGIFTRPSKLTRKVLTEDEANGTQTAHASRATSPTSTSAASMVSSSAAALPPSGIPQKTSPLAAKEHSTPQITNLSKTASESISNLSEAGSLKKGERELKIGDRVLVRFLCSLCVCILIDEL